MLLGGVLLGAGDQLLRSAALTLLVLLGRLLFRCSGDPAALLPPVTGGRFPLMDCERTALSAGDTWLRTAGDFVLGIGLSSDGSRLSEADGVGFCFGIG